MIILVAFQINSTNVMATLLQQDHCQFLHFCSCSPMDLLLQRIRTATSFFVETWTLNVVLLRYEYGDYDFAAMNRHKGSHVPWPETEISREFESELKTCGRLNLQVRRSIVTECHECIFRVSAIIESCIFFIYPIHLAGWFSCWGTIAISSKWD